MSGFESSKQARYQLSHPSFFLATHFPKKTRKCGKVQYGQKERRQKDERKRGKKEHKMQKKLKKRHKEVKATQA
jgi:hypothetical protein